jgi:hypothetical protein
MIKSELIEISLWMPQTMVIVQGLLYSITNPHWILLEFTKSVYKPFMNRFNSYVG